MSVRNDVDRGLQIIRQLDTLERELIEIEARLEKAGLEGEQIALQDAAREGRQYLAHGSHEVVPIVFSADLLVKSFAEGSDAAKRILAALESAKAFNHFFRRVVTFKALIDSGKQFRHEAAEWLGNPAAGQFISACLQRDKHGIPKSQTKIEWSRADVAQVSNPPKDGFAVANLPPQESEVA